MPPFALAHPLTAAAAVALLVLTGIQLAKLAAPRDAGPLERATIAGLLAASVGTVIVRVLLTAGWLRPWVLLVALIGCAAASVVRARRSDVVRPRLPHVDWTCVPPLVAAGCAVWLAIAAATLLPIWQWDAIGYHLPTVAFTLQDGRAAALPKYVPYVSTYPHNVEAIYTLVRAFLPSDELVDLAQIPFGLLGAVAAATIGAGLGASVWQALAAGALWLTLPAVFLQLPTNYVDVATASYFLAAAALLLAPPDRRRVLLAGLALGLYLGAKPSAPIPTAVLCLALAVRAWRAGERRALLGAAALVLAFGAERYVVNVARFGNPVWPAELRVGPWKLPGRASIESMLAAGAKLPRPAPGPTWRRVLESWTNFTTPPVFDMRLGGLGGVFVLAALPGSIVALALRLGGRIRDGAGRALPLVVAGAAIVHPEPSTPRFVLAFPALVLAYAAAMLPRLPRRAAVAVLGASAALAFQALWYATPGLTGEGPPLAEYVKMSRAERLRAVGPEGHPDEWLRLHASLAPGEACAFDPAFTLPYFLWRSDLRNRVVALREDDPPEQIVQTLEANRVRYVAVGDATNAGKLAASDRARFRPLFRCKSDPCTVYELPSR